MKDLVVIIICVVVGFWLSWEVKEYFTPEPKEIVTTDTLYVEVPYEVEVIEEVEVPKTVTIYETIRDTIETIKTVRDTIVVNDTLYYHESFLTGYVDQPKFLGAERDGRKVSFTTQDPSGIVSTRTYYPGNRNWVHDGKNLKVGKDARGLRVSGGIGWLHPSYPYAQVSGKYPLFGTDVHGSVWLTERPFVTIGVSWDL